MKIQSKKLAQAVKKLAGIVAKSPAKPALGGILVKDGYLTATNTEITIRTKLEEAEGENFILPQKSFDILKSLPDGEVEIKESNLSVEIKMKKIKNKYQTFPAHEFAYDSGDWETGSNEFIISGEKLINALKHVLFAAADNSAHKNLNGICFDYKADQNVLNVLATDGYVFAWDKIEPASSPSNSMKVVVPKASIQKLLSLGFSNDDIKVTWNDRTIIFHDEKCTLYTRIVDTTYIGYEKFIPEFKFTISAKKDEFVSAISRARLCADNDRPLVWEMKGSELDMRINDAATDYNEQITLEEEAQELKIGLKSKYILDALSAFDTDNVKLGFVGSISPVVAFADNMALRTLVLPVRMATA